MDFLNCGEIFVNDEVKTFGPEVVEVGDAGAEDQVDGGVAVVVVAVAVFDFLLRRPLCHRVQQTLFQMEPAGTLKQWQRS